jgi:ArsR family transcriptional regulator, lead/cadmium/zinc/bismuth-responsive transcriptional repressor
VHLIPADRADQRIIDAEQVCEAIAALGDPASVRGLAQHFAVLADPTRLMLLICIRAAGPISVSDLAVATGLQDATVSQALRYLRASQIVTAQRHGRVIRYQLADHPVSALLANHQDTAIRPMP